MIYIIHKILYHLGQEKDKTIEDNIMKDVKNLFRLKK